MILAIIANHYLIFAMLFMQLRGELLVRGTNMIRKEQFFLGPIKL